MVEKVTHIGLSEIKNGQFIQLENDKLYVVVKRGQTYKLIPIVLSDVIEYNQYAIKQPKILRVFKASNGDCIKMLDEKGGETNE